MRWKTALAAAAVVISVSSFAQTNPVGTGDSRVDFLMALAQRESGGRKDVINSFGYLGLFQMGGAALVEARFYMLGPSKKENAWDGSFTSRANFVEVTSQQTYLDHAGAQELAVRAYHDAQWGFITRLGLASRTGDVIGGATLSKSGMIAGAHLVGVGGLQRFILSNGADILRDGNGVPITEYIRLFGHYY